jgi:hypothetical protein
MMQTYTNFEELRGKLLALHDVDHMSLVGDASFFQKCSDFLATAEDLAG